MQMDYMNRERSRGNPRAKLVQKSAEKKRKRLKILDRIIQFKTFFERLCRLGDDQRPHAFSRSDGVQTHTLLANAFGKRKHGKRRQRLASFYAPSLQNFVNSRTRGKHAYG